MQAVLMTSTLVWWTIFVPGCYALSLQGTILYNFSKRFTSDAHGAFWKWNNSDDNPCSWPGVGCVADQVKAVNLSNRQLVGSLDPQLAQISTLQILLLNGNKLNGSIPDQFGSLKDLRILDLRSNSLSGTIPPGIGGAQNLTNLLLGLNALSGSIPEQLGNLKELAMLDLSYNKLTGNIPPEIGNAKNLVQLYLHNNALQGSIPPEIGNLKTLKELRVERNKLSGNIPLGALHVTDNTKDTENRHDTKGLCLLQNLKIANFAFNFLNGSVPSCLHNLSTNFEWNCFDSKIPHQRPAEQCGRPRENMSHVNTGLNIHHTRLNKKLQMIIVVGSFICLFLVLGILFRYRYVAISVSPSKDVCSYRHDKNLTTGAALFCRRELELACEDFSNIIGCVSNGVVFKGTLSNGNEVAVTKFKTCDWSHESEIQFLYRVDRLARINHDNIVKLLGYCAEEEPLTRMIVFEYASNGTLFDLLHNNESEHLDWNARMRIIMGVAYGLEYMHHNLDPPAGYSKFDSTLVYLTEDNAAKLVGFEVGKPPIAVNWKDTHFKQSHSVNRNFGDFKTNVFCFGILLLEIISGRLPYCKKSGSIIDWSAQYLTNKEMMSYMVDPALRLFNYEQLQALCEIISMCLGAESSRPTMKAITNMLESSIGMSREIACPKRSPLLWAEMAILNQV